YYEVEVEAGGKTVAVPYKYVVDYRVFSRAKFGQLSYGNSLGGIDSIRVLGKIQQTSQFSFDSAEQSTEGSYHNLHDLRPQIRQVGMREKRTYKANVGYVSEELQQALRDANINRRVFYPKGKQWLPVIITSTQ